MTSKISVMRCICADNVLMRSAMSWLLLNVRSAERNTTCALSAICWPDCSNVSIV